MGLERALAAFADIDSRLKALVPRVHEGPEAQLRRERRHLAALRGGDQCDSLVASEIEVESDRAKAQRPGVPEADGVLTVGLAVDAALDTNATRAGRGDHGGSSFGSKTRSYAEPRTRLMPLKDCSQKLTKS